MKRLLLRYPDLSILVPLILLAAATRAYGLGRWAFEGDEIFTVLDSLAHPFNAKPGNYVLVAGLFKVWGVSEITARIPAALFGIAGVPVMYFLAKPFAGRAGAAFAACFLVFDYWHLYLSQFARYYTAVFFFAGLSYLYAYRAYREGRVAFLFAALGLNVAGALFHPTIVAVSLTHFLFYAAALFVRPPGTAPHSLRVARIALWIYGAGALAALPLAWFILSEWSQVSSTLGGGWGKGFADQALSIVKYIGLPVSVVSVFGLAAVWRRDVAQGLFLGIAGAVPAVLLSLGSLMLDLRADYVFYTLPVFLILAGALCGEIRDRTRGPGSVSLAPFSVILAAMLPEFASHYTSKRSLDVRDALAVVTQGYRPGDEILTFSPEYKYYLPDGYTAVGFLGGTYESRWETKLARYEDFPGRLWVAMTLHRQPMSKSLEAWLAKHATLVWEGQSTRYDYSLDVIRVYRTR